MSVTLNGYLGGPLENLRTMVSESTTFQKLTRSANAAAALDRIYRLAKQGDPARPFAVVSIDEARRASTSYGSKTHLKPSGRLQLWLEIAVETSAAVSSAASGSVFTASGLAGHADDYFNGLELYFTSGANAGAAAIAIADFNGATGELTLASAFSSTPSAADAFIIRPANDGDAAAHFLNSVGGVMQEIEDKSGRGGYLNLISIVLIEHGRANKDQTDADYFGAVVEVEYAA